MYPVTMVLWSLSWFYQKKSHNCSC